MMITENTDKNARMQLAAEVEQLLNSNTTHKPMHWTASNIDLMEALYIAYDTGTLTDTDTGQPLPFKQLVRRACTLLNRPMPRNPYDCARRGNMRKGVRHHNFLTCYQLLLTNGHQRPFLEKVKK